MNTAEPVPALETAQTPETPQPTLTPEQEKEFARRMGLILAVIRSGRRKEQRKAAARLGIPWSIIQRTKKQIMARQATGRQLGKSSAMGSI